MIYWISLYLPLTAVQPLGRSPPAVIVGFRDVSPESVASVFQIITALEEDGTAQKMQLAYRLQQIAAAVENKVTDL